MYILTFLLSKKRIAISAVLLLIIVGFSFIIMGRGTKVDNNTESIKALSLEESLRKVVALKLNTTDTDNDGLKDWEEDLWNTDPENSDTDGDGVKDGIEVDTDRNPTIPGPDDALSGGIPSSVGNDGGEDLTVTDQFARNFFSEYLRFKKSGLLDSEEGREFLVRSASSKVPTLVGVVYKDSDLLITNDNSAEALRRYGNNMGSVLDRLSINTRNEAVILLDALQSNNAEILKELAPTKEFYRAMGKESLKINVPSNAVSVHLALLNSFRNIENTIDAMERIFEDPLYTISALETYQQYATDLALAFQGATAFFENNNITFEDMEPGHTLVHILN